MEFKIIDFDDLGNGIARINEKVSFVKRGIKGEVVDIEILNEKKNYSNSIIKNIIVKSPDRINPICPFYDNCGGCQFLHLKEECEKEFKINKARKFFSKCDNFYETTNLNYRNKVKLHVKNGNIGYYKEKTNDLVSISNCYLLNNNINRVIKLFSNYFDPNFNGLITIRENSQGEIILVIDGCFKYINNLKNYDLITNLIYNNQVIKGKTYFIENIFDYKFKVSFNSFFQVNRLGLERIYLVLTNFLKDKNISTSLDLYSGTSVLGIHLAKYSKKVISVEINSSATKDALVNLNLNNITNLEVINDKVENVIDRFNLIDLVIVDPVRSGLDKKTIENLKRINSKYLIYIACSMDSLKRDLSYLSDTYNLDNLYLVDMFPRTNNVESVAILRLK
ncbi:MAG: class I SAM-dependent RNA methyltransferase [Bacilli bacterium]|nr:class I SAM-dependent RNA methyltransferase [Bacilli bacterium]